MESARSIFRRASRRLSRRSRRGERRTSEMSVESMDSVVPPPTATAEEIAEKRSMTSSERGESVSQALSGDEMLAAAAKLSDADTNSSISTEDLPSPQPSAPVSAIEGLLQKQRRELMCELLTIQNSHRPVSKGDQRRRLERFLRQHIHGDVSDSISVDSNDGSESSSSSRQRRNGVVTMELEGLSRQQSVTQRLQSDGFRQRLENIIRSTIGRQEREVEAALRLRTAGLPGNRRVPLAAEGGAVADTASQASGISSFSDSSSLHISVLHEGVPAAPPPPPPPGQGMAAPRAPHIPPPPPPQPPQLAQGPARWHTAQQQRQQRVQHHNQSQQQNGGRWPLPSDPWLLRGSRGNNAPATEATPPAEIQQVQREAIISEISDLVHRQIVHETLESDFRGRLEFLMMNRLSNTDSNGAEVMNFVNSIQQSRPHRRNDFSHLGIRVARSDQHAEGGAVGGAAFMSEMESLRSRMDELHEMVRMSMEMQLDLQRAIRQEVAAALHQQNGTTPTPASMATHPASEGNCIICLDKEVDAVLYQCGHMCVCLTCGLRLSTMGSHCPMCRAPIRDVIRAYRCQRE
ncbi:uncharacterized protein [Diadema setosum]|uniref:uncharacterized protein n=1 Tax=Diadema setosum TaxID=31175 RepID=UPI003B3B2A71